MHSTASACECVREREQDPLSRFRRSCGLQSERYTGTKPIMLAMDSELVGGQPLTTKERSHRKPSLPSS